MTYVRRARDTENRNFHRLPPRIHNNHNNKTTYARVCIFAGGMRISAFRLNVVTIFHILLLLCHSQSYIMHVHYSRRHN